MVFAMPAGAAAQSHNTLLRQAPIEIMITLSDPDTESAWFSLSAVNDMNNTLILPPCNRVGSGASVANRDSWHCELEIDDDNKRVRAVRQAGALGADITIKTFCIEFMPFVIEARQHGSISMASGTLVSSATKFADITSQSKADRTLTCFLGQTTDQTTQSRGYTEQRLGCYTFSETVGATITSTRTFSTGNVTIGYMSVLFADGILETAANYSAPTITSGTSSTEYAWETKNAEENPTITSLAKCLFAFNNCNTDGGFQNEHPYFTLTVDGATAVRNKSTSNDERVSLECAEFRSKWVKDGEQGLDRIAASATTEDVTISTLDDLNKAIYAFIGQTTDNTASNVDRFPATLQLTSLTNIRLERGFGGANFVDVAWSVLQFR